MKPKMSNDHPPPGDAEFAPIALNDMGRAMVLVLLLRRLLWHMLRMHHAYIIRSLCAPPAASFTLTVVCNRRRVSTRIPAPWRAVVGGFSVTGKARRSPSSKHSWNGKMWPTWLAQRNATSTPLLPSFSSA